jgi:malonate decarboxylase delta subunit
MERLQYEFAAGQPAAGRALTGVVSSGDLEVMLEPRSAGNTTVLVLTSVNGFGAVWQALLDRVFGSTMLPAAHIEIHDSGATPGVVRMRIEQAFEEAAQEGNPGSKP